MPAKVYHYFKVNQFPDLPLGEFITTSYQGSLIDQVDDTPHSTITAQGLADLSNFHRFHVLHEYYQDVNGRYLGQTIKSYIAKIEFHLFFEPHKSIALLDANKKNCDNFIKRFQSSNHQMLDFQSRKIDLRRLANDLKSNIRGGWFGNVEIADVSSVALYGPTVGDSTEWGRYDALGILRTVDVALQWDNLFLTTKIMANRGIILYGNINERSMLEFLLNTHEKLNQYELEA